MVLMTRRGNMMQRKSYQLVVKKDSAEFVQRTKNIITEFNGFNPVDTLHVNGDATQGENIADLGGLLLGGLMHLKNSRIQKEMKRSAV